MVKKIIIAAIPAITVIALHISIRTWPQSYSSINIWFLLLIMPQLIGLSTAFLSNLLIPVATPQRLSIKMAGITAFAYLFFWTIILIHPISATLDGKIFDILWFLVIIVPESLLLWVNVAYFGWLGTQLNIIIRSRHAH